MGTAAAAFSRPKVICPGAVSLRKITGLPCPSCGCTRSLLAWFHADLAAALRFNPLFFVACLVSPVWLITAALAKAFCWRWPERPREHLWELAARWPLWQFVLALVALNWLYLCLNLPK
jgi:hypothetical protein